MRTTTVCTMCELEPATKTWGLPVCQHCYESLIVLDYELKDMETRNPGLAELGIKAEDAFKQYLEHIREIG